MHFKKPPKHNPPYRTMRELSDLFADDHGESIEICYLLVNVREGLGMEPAIGFQEGAKYSYEQQLELVQYNNQHPRKNRKWRKLSLRVLEKNSRR